MPRETQRSAATQKGGAGGSKEQSARGTSTQTGGGGDRERNIDTQREQGAVSTRRPLSSRVYGTDAGPFSVMRRMADDMDRLFNFGFGRHFGLGPLLEFPRDDTMWSPQVETFRRGDRIVVRADLPGIKKEDVKVELDNDVLSISGERTEEREEDREDLYRSERTYGHFYRAIPLPEGVDANQVEATFNDGVLEVSVATPKESPRRAKQISIR